MGGMQGTSRQSSSRPVPNTSMGSSQYNQIGQQNRQLGTGFGTNMGGIASMMRQQQQSMPGTPSQKHMSHLNDDMDALGEMDMDDIVDPTGMDDNQRTIQQTRQMFGQQPRPQLHLNSSGLTQQALRTSQPTTPAGSGFGFHNPTVSSVNTPTLTTQPFAHRGQNQFQQDGLPDVDDDLPGMPMKMNLGNMGFNGLNMNQFGGLGFGNSNGNGLNFGTIDNPAKQLYSPGGGNMMTQQQQNLHNQFAQFGIDPSQLPPGTDPVSLLQQLAPLAMQEEHKPFKCPVIGCEKAYKNQNGLKYHKTHGHSTQQLHENGDGTFSIVNPETSAPYPGTLGMEKEKPFKCDICGKRYKNLNGLKYVSHTDHLVTLPEIRLILINSNSTSNTLLCAIQR